MDRHLTFTASDRELFFISLSRLLDDTYNHLADTRALYFHLQAGGHAPDTMAASVGAAFEAHYTEMAQTVELVIRRMHEIGLTDAPTPSRSSLFAQPAGGAATCDVITRVLDNHAILIANAQKVLDHLANLNDELTTALLTTRIKIHERRAQRLRALLVTAGCATESPLRAAS